MGMPVHTAVLIESGVIIRLQTSGFNHTTEAAVWVNGEKYFSGGARFNQPIKHAQELADEEAERIADMADVVSGKREYMADDWIDSLMRPIA